LGLTVPASVAPLLVMLCAAFVVSVGATVQGVGVWVLPLRMPIAKTMTLSARARRIKPRRKGDRLIESLASGVVAFDLNKFIAIVPSLSG
jgi:hypothetical protein